MLHVWLAGALLAMSGSGVFQAPDPAVASIKGTFDLVLSDQQMPMMTGIQLCEHLREIPAYRRTPFVLLTA